MDDATPEEKLRKVEAPKVVTASDVRRAVVRLTATRMRLRLAEVRAREPDVECVYSMPDRWGRKLFVALCRGYGLQPYRKPGQRETTVELLAPESFQKGMLMDEFIALTTDLEKQLFEATDRVIRSASLADVSEGAASEDPQDSTIG
jgi:hypothetical protein